MLVDVVVRDRKNQPVRDLTQADFEVREDGVAQTIGSFAPVREGVTLQASTATGDAAPVPSAPAAGASPVGTRPAAPGGPPVTALVFHGLNLEARRRAVQAAQAYVGETEETANYIAVFGIDFTLRPLVPFTRNGVAVRQALKVLASGSSQMAGAAPERDPTSIADRATPATPSGTPGGPGGGGGGVDAQLQAMAAQMMNGFEIMERDRQGYIATDALSAMVHTMGRLPGRKSIVLFSEGIKLPPGVYRLFLGVIDAANRANVSIYTVDAAGLRTESAQRAGRDTIYSAGSTGFETGYAGEVGGGPLGANMEAIEYGLRSDPHFGLGQLAEDTGGLLLESTNNFKPAFERLNSDLRNYYLIGYTPLKRTFDGKFRTIQVKVKRSGVAVAARKGYFAVRNPGDMPLSAWEAPALGALEEKPLPNAFPIRAAAFLFPERGRPGLVPVVAEVPTAPLTFQAAADGKSYTSDFTVLVRFLDGDNQVVRKLSQRYEIRGELAQYRGREARSGRVLPRIGAAAGRLFDGDGRARCAGQQGERPVVHGRSPAPRRAPAPRKQPDARDARRGSGGEGTPGRTPAAGERRGAPAEPRSTSSAAPRRKPASTSRSTPPPVRRRRSSSSWCRTASSRLRCGWKSRQTLLQDESSNWGVCRSTSSPQALMSCGQS